VETYLTVADVAELLKLNPQTIRNWIDRGELPAVRVGPRRVRIRQSDLDALLERGRNVPDNLAVAAAPADPIDESWNRFRSALVDSERAANSGSTEALREPLATLSASAQELAVVLRRQD
jgi:excisionase family DNA binding protein